MKNLTRRHHFALLLVIGIVLYSPLTTFSFLIGWDDQVYVLNSYTENGLTFKNVYAVFTSFYYGQYAPLNQLYYSSVFEISGYNPVLFHTFSVIIHLANACLVYVFIEEITDRIFSSQYNNSRISFITAFLFLITPINLEPVAWVAASKVLIFAFFYLCSLISYIRYVKTWRSRYYYFTLLGFVLSFAAKEQALMMPLAMTLIDYTYSRNFRKALPWLEKLPPAILSMLFVLASFESQNRFIFISGEAYSLIDRILLAFYTISEYFTKIILPVNISYAYPFPFLPVDKPPFWLWIFPVFLTLAGYCLRRILLQKHVFFGGMFFIIHIIMVSNFVSLSRFSVVADRYAYIPSIGVLWLVVIALTILFKRAKPSIRSLYVTFVLVYCGYFFIYTSIHLWVWQNSITLKEKIRNEIKSRRDYEK